jgi:hypothetical protein
MTDTWQYLTPQDPEGGIPDEWVWERLRLLRYSLLSQSDSRVGTDAPGDVDAWKAYRQQLRDLPANTTDPRQAVWPAPPTSTTRNPNRVAIEEQAAQALDVNRTFLALATPTNAQTLAQVKALSRQNVRVIRLLLNQLDGTD